MTVYLYRHIQYTLIAVSDWEGSCEYKLQFLQGTMQMHYLSFIAGHSSMQHAGSWPRADKLS
jgi:hypothetical protein